MPVRRIVPNPPSPARVHPSVWMDVVFGQHPWQEPVERVFRFDNVVHERPRLRSRKNRIFLHSTGFRTSKSRCGPECANGLIHEVLSRSPRRFTPARPMAERQSLRICDCGRAVEPDWQRYDDKCESLALRFGHRRNRQRFARDRTPDQPLTRGMAKDYQRMGGHFDMGTDPKTHRGMDRDATSSRARVGTANPRGVARNAAAHLCNVSNHRGHRGGGANAATGNDRLSGDRVPHGPCVVAARGRCPSDLIACPAGRALSQHDARAVAARWALPERFNRVPNGPCVVAARRALPERFNVFSSTRVFQFCIP